MRPPRCHLLARRRPLAYQVDAAIGPKTRRPPRTLTTLAIETSCDDTAVAILSRDDDDGGRRCSLLFNERVTSDHRQFRGVEPLVAVQGHTSALAPLLRRALAHLPHARTDAHHAFRGCCWPAADGVARRIPDFVSVTRGPGIMPNLSVGLNTAKGLAVAWDVPLVGVHHMQAHALTPRLARALRMPMLIDEGASDLRDDRRPGPELPFLSLLVSGGHTQLVHSRSLVDHRIIATTADIALGNLLDHAARDILPPEVLDASEDVMYGRVLEAFAFLDGGTPDEYASAFQPASSRGAELKDPDTGYGWVLPIPLRQTRRLAYSFSSIGTTVRRIADSRPSMDVAERRALARHTMATAFGHLAGRLCLALEDEPGLRDACSTVVVAGGVACNRFLMHVLRSTLAARGYGHLRFVVPPSALCTDNAAMIAWTGLEMYDAGFHTDLSVLAINKWPMDPDEGPGILGAPGWLRRPGHD